MQVGAVAGLAVVLPEQVHRADQPVLVRRHDPHGPAIRPRPRTPGPADQRDVVEVDDVGVGRVEHLAQGSALKKGGPVTWVASGERMPKPLSSGWTCRPGGGVYGRERMVAADRVERVDAVEDVDLMPAAAERLAEPIDVGGVPAEAVGRRRTS